MALMPEWAAVVGGGGLIRLRSGVHNPGTEEAESPKGSSAPHGGRYQEAW